jgi:molecular chaperone GrpE
MQSGWDKVTRWAGIGNNGKDQLEKDGSYAEMLEEAKLGNEVGQEMNDVEAIEGGTEPLAAELEQVKGERDQLLDRLARLQAEFDNARKREAKERADTREYTIGATVEPFLGVMDNFQLALKAQGSADQLRAGVELILKQMEEALKSMQVVAVETIGVQFDPRIHEALGSIETAEFPDHQVIEEIRRGYKIREKLLRPAMVKIAVNSAQVND